MAALAGIYNTFEKTPAHDTVAMDIDDVIELNDLLKTKYPLLNFRIILVNLCKFCCKNRNLNNLYPNIIIINEPILDIRENPLHNKILTGKYFEKIFIEKIKSILST